MNRFIGVAGLCLLTAGCVGAGATPEIPLVGSDIQFEGTPIWPTQGIKAARIYRSIDKLESVGPGSHFTQICPEDFAQTAALKDIDTSVFPTDIYIGTRSASRDVSVGGSLSGLNLGAIAQAGASAKVVDTVSMDVTNVRKSELSDTGVDIVRAKIGDGCRKIVRKWIKAGHVVFIALATYKADKLKVTVTFAPEADVNFGVKIVKNILPGIKLNVKDSRTATATTDNAVIEIRSASAL